MRVRIKFSRHGAMKFIGHLDVMRYFQKAIRRADLPVVLSGGFSPHMIMSFASPLGVGITSDGEYFDLDLQDGRIGTEEVRDLLDAQMTDLFRVKNVVCIPDDKNNKCMSVIAAARYLTGFRKGAVRLPDELLAPEGMQAEIRRFLELKEITVMRKTKRSEQMTDIRPWILSADAAGEEEVRALASREEDTMDLQLPAFDLLLSAGSVQNLKPELVVQAFADFAGVPGVWDRKSLIIHRLDLFAQTPEGLRSLDKAVF